LNNIIQALLTLSSGADEPPQTFGHMLWYETDTNILKMRSEADDAWISIGYLDQSVNAFRILDDTQVTNTSGTQTGLLGDQATATWEAGTGTTESLVSPAKVKAAIDALAGAVGVGQTWQDLTASRSFGTSYQNTEGRPIAVAVLAQSTNTITMQVSDDNATWINVGSAGGFGNIGDTKTAVSIIPDDWYYRLLVVAGTTNVSWSELR
jgi:hypothetical protein